MEGRIPKIISFDMDGTLVDPDFTDWVWLHGIPSLYAEKAGLPFEEAKHFVVEEYLKVGEGAIEWYDIKYWFQYFRLETSWRDLMQRYVDKIKVYPDVRDILEKLKEKFPIILTSNAGREFIDIEMKTAGLRRYFDQIFSATSDFGEVKKTMGFYQRICSILGVTPREMIHIGDHYEFDYLVPRSLGILAYYLDRSSRQNGEDVLNDLREFEKRLNVLIKMPEKEAKSGKEELV
ncbi:MAG: HAD family hydrolase [Syntrophaceae bacterium]|nr:HAD family hydrolase [Syntrophaceae bacterium]